MLARVLFLSLYAYSRREAAKRCYRGHFIQKLSQYIILINHDIFQKKKLYTKKAKMNIRNSQKTQPLQRRGKMAYDYKQIY